MAAIESEASGLLGSIYLGVGEDEANSVYKKTKRENVSKLRLSVTIMATACLLAAEGIASFKCIRQSSTIHVNVFFYWVQSCFITLILKLWTGKRNRSLRLSIGPLLPVLALHLLLVMIWGLDTNRTLYGASGGSEIYQVGLVTAPSVVLMATWHLFQQCYPVNVVIFVGLSSLLQMAVVCSENDPYIPFKVTFGYGTLGILNGTFMAYHVVLLKKYLSKLSPAQLLYYLNLSCAVVLPFVVLFTDEFTALRKELPRVVNHMSLFQQIITLALLKLSSQVALLLLLCCASPMLALATRGLSWIVLTIALSLLGTSMNVELLVSDFIAFWVIIFLFFLPVFIVELKKIK